ncbi:hypothetical protein [Nocardioides sp.]|uniref:HNH endonuclease n=1 Tax=Nocardioides sp. TaxID=35761 RepID=UPI0026273265|nr:hypothetical protein [Nocardioides sp.]
MKRTSLTRKTPLQARSGLRRTPAETCRTRPRRPHRRATATGPSQTVRLLVKARAEGRCERCATRVLSLDDQARTWPVYPYSIHHRIPRGMGGTSRPELNQPGNLVLLCGTGVDGCHGWIESHRHAAAEAGWLLPTSTADPTTVPVVLWHGRPVYLLNDGTPKEKK